MDVKEAIQKRRAYRSLEPVEITLDLILEIAKTAQVAPSCMNKQPWRFIFVKDKEQLQKLFMVLTPANKWIEKASMMIAVFSQPENDCMIRERNYYLFDTGMAVGLILLRATELGLVAHPIAGFDEEKAKEIVGIPKEMRLITFINVGKKSDDINPVLSEHMKLGEKQRPPRNPLKEFAYIDKYGEPLNE